MLSIPRSLLIGSHDRVMTCADPSYDNPSFSIFNTKDYTNSAPLTLTILLQSWPVSTNCESQTSLELFIDLAF